MRKTLEIPNTLRKVERDDEPLGENERQLAIMDISGHSILRWDASDAESCKDAEKLFDSCIQRGFRAFEYSPIAQGKGRQVAKFTPHLNEIIMVPPLAGG